MTASLSVESKPTTLIRPRDRDSILQSLRAGVVPRIGLQHVQVGRHREIEAMLTDITRLVDGGSAFRLVIGEYGAGKTFFLNVVRSVALEKKLVVATADLNPDRRLYATGGQSRSLYAELMRSLATRAKPDGGALSGVVEKFVSAAETDARASGNSVSDVIQERLNHLAELVNGYDFAAVIGAYYRGHEEGNERLKIDAIRWLRGEFSTKTDARNALGVRSIIDDSEVFEQLKLMARFVRLAGYSGLLVGIDEMVNLYKLSNTQARNANYEQLLRILNDSLQGSAVGLGFILGGTPEFLLDPRRGLYSYQALQSRLAQNTFAKDGMVDYMGPVLRLSALTPEDLYVLLENVTRVYASGDSSKELVDHEGRVAFMSHCENKIGEAYFRTPRTTITAYIGLLAAIEQNPGQTWQSLLGKVAVVTDEGGKADLSPEADDDLTSFKI